MRTATLQDLAEIRDVYRRSSLSNAGDRDALLAHPDALVWRPDGITSGRTRVAETPGARIVGFASLLEIDGSLELEDLFVDPDFMRTGVATLLIRDCVEAALRSGHAWIEVVANPHAAEFYASAGFVRVGETDTRFGPAPRLRRDVS